MKNLKLIALASVLTIGTTITVNAQDAANKQPVKESLKKERQVKIEEMKEELKLSDEQVQKIKAIHAKKEAEKETYKDKVQEINKAEKEEINQVLTDEQKAILKAKRMEHRKAQSVKNAQPEPAEKAVAPRN